jgi:VanZ family protein
MPQLRRFAYYALPLLLWMALIFALSTDSGSTQTTNPIVHEILRKIFPGVTTYLTEEQIHFIDFCLRKGAHIVEYTVLALFAFRAFRYGRQRFQNYMAYGPPLFSVCYAASDEFHQTFSALRGPAVSDVFIDAFGVLLGTFIALWGWCQRLERTRSPQP